MPDFGYTVRNAGGLLTVDQVSSAAADSGLQAGDVLVKATFNGSPLEPSQFNTLGGKTIIVSLRRGNSDLELPLKVGIREVTNYKAVSLTQPSLSQLRIREAWLKR